MGTLHEDQFTFMVISHTFLLTVRIVSEKNCTEYQNTHFMFNNFFFSIIVPFVRKCVKIFRAGQATDDNVIRRTRIACWITMATDTHSEFFLHCNMVARTRLTVRYTSIACLVQYWFTFAKKLSTIHCCVWSLLADINGCGICFACVCIAVTCC